MEQNNKSRDPVLRASDGVCLRDYVDRILAEHQRAVDKAEAMIAARLASMNGIREQLREQAASFVVRAEYDSKHELLRHEINRLRTDVDLAKGKASQTSLLFVAAIALAGLIVSVIELVMK